MRRKGLGFNDTHMTVRTRYRAHIAGFLAGIVLLLAGCEVLTLRGTGGNRGVEGAEIGVKF